MFLCEWLLVTHSLWCLWLLTDTCDPDTVITHSVCQSRSSPSRGVWPLSVEASGLALFASCVSPILGHARALRTRVRLSLSCFSLVGGFLSLVSWHVSLSLNVPLVSSLISLVLRLGARPPFSLFTSPLFRLASIAGQPAFSGVASSWASELPLDSTSISFLIRGPRVCNIFSIS